MHYLIASQSVNCCISFKSYCLYARCFFLLFLYFSLAALSLSERGRAPVPGADKALAEEKTRVAATAEHGPFGRDRKGARKEDVVNLHRLLVATEKPRETSIAAEISNAAE